MILYFRMDLKTTFADIKHKINLQTFKAKVTKTGTAQNVCSVVNGNPRLTFKYVYN